jgi:subtilisin family serine protease
LRLKAEQLQQQGLSGQGVIVGHLDTGADGGHPALKSAFHAFAEFDMMGFQVTPSPAAHDTDEHGTHTAGTIAGRDVGGVAIGMAPGALLASAIVIEGGNATARVLAGMDWIIGQGAKILSMSLGFRGYLEDFLPLTQILRDRGVLPVFAIGNEGPGTSRSPGNYDISLSVGAMDQNDKVANFSGSQQFARPVEPIVPCLVGPGVGVISAMPGGGYQEMDGSSMATPHIAGLAALLMEAKPQASIDQIEKAIFDSCALLPGELPEGQGLGVPDGVQALALL